MYDRNETDEQEERYSFWWDVWPLIAFGMPTAFAVLLGICLYIKQHN
jgi:hypothetical protein